MALYHPISTHKFCLHAPLVAWAGRCEVSFLMMQREGRWIKFSPKEGGKEGADSKKAEKRKRLREHLSRY
jgi:hypothetical protein